MKASKLTKETILDLNATDRGFPEFGVGDTVEVAQIVKEGNKERLQMFLGDVIGIKTNGVSSTFTVRKMGANNIGVEKIFPYFSPMIDKIKVVKRGDVRQSKLYYIRDRIGRAARIKEKIETRQQIAAAQEQARTARAEAEAAKAAKKAEAETASTETEPTKVDE